MTPTAAKSNNKRLMVPARVAQALAPWLFGMCLDAFCAKSLWLSSGLGLVAIAMLMTIRQVEPQAECLAAGYPRSFCSAHAMSLGEERGHLLEQQRQ
jgi:hypothetical protein